MGRVPTDRGFVTITELPDGSKNVEIFAGRTGSTLTSLFARHSGVDDVAVTPGTPLTRTGSVRTSQEVCEVYWDEEEQRLTVRRPVAMPGLIS
ncbi:hypothetical protein [Paractinoplanes hotanensis]|uniref:Uncharacterized protein n=1 Tax=Paractinoplanes hotanensis TaxID=2906497 RepID=A0ABT0Y4C0_9ACTN|nr:hypothetical protein [Actinoplanes hotanensis]MCM4080889.1 hypothetical protein [Actinoplanes hotanensis]